METLAVSTEDGVTVLTPTARRLDAALAPVFKAEAVAQIDQGARQIAVDLSGVDFLDSSGLGALVSILKALGGRGAIVVCGVRGSVEALFKLTRMDKVFTLVATRADAVARLAGR
jgi:anti-sigma B factor antagonist